MGRRNALSEKQEIELTSGSTTHGRGKKPLTRAKTGFSFPPTQVQFFVEYTPRKFAMLLILIWCWSCATVSGQYGGTRDRGRVQPQNSRGVAPTHRPWLTTKMTTIDMPTKTYEDDEKPSESRFLLAFLVQQFPNSR